MIVSWNGTLLDGGEITLPVSDAVFLRGEGVFETIRAENGHPQLWEAHYQRLTESAQKFGFAPPPSQVLRGSVEGLISANQLTEARVRITLGTGCLITAEPLPDVEETIDVVTSDCPVNERSPLAQVKCTSYAENMMLLREVGASEVIRPNTRGELCEGCISNVFFVKEGIIHTPSLKSGCLPGVMRQRVIDCVEVKEGEWPLRVLDGVEEIWLSNALRRLRLVSSLNGRRFGEASGLFARISAKI